MSSAAAVTQSIALMRQQIEQGDEIAKIAVEAITELERHDKAAADRLFARLFDINSARDHVSRSRDVDL